MKKKVLAALLAMGMILSCAGCGDPAESKTGENQGKQTEQQEEL